MINAPEIDLSDLSGRFFEIINNNPLPDPDGEKAECYRVISQQQSTTGIQLAFKGSRTTVRLYVLGKPRYFAYAPHRYEVDLARFADLLIWKLWHLKMNSNENKIRDCDLNFTVAGLEDEWFLIQKTHPLLIDLVEKIVKRVNDVRASMPAKLSSAHSRRSILGRTVELQENTRKLLDMRDAELSQKLDYLTGKIEYITGQIDKIWEVLRK